jgi:hypothetical protein
MKRQQMCLETAKTQITTQDFEEYTEVSGATVGQIFSVANDVAVLLSAATSIFYAPAGSAAYSGATYMIGVTLVPLAEFSAGVMATALFAGDLLLAAISLPAILATLGVPVAEAKQQVAERSIRSGFAVGSVVGIFGYDKSTLYSFKDRTTSTGFAPAYLAGIGSNAFNKGLALGYIGAQGLNPAIRQKYLDTMTAVLIHDAKRRNRRLNMQNWSEMTWVFEYAAIFGRLPRASAHVRCVSRQLVRR